MADSSTTNHGTAGQARRYSEPIHISAIVPDVCAKIQARCQRTLRRRCTPGREPARPARLAG